MVVLPLEVVEDNRCPENAPCVSPGRLVVRTLISTEGRSELADIILGGPRRAPGSRW
jgi:hypothetical protein